MTLADELEQAFKTATGSVRLNTPKPYVLWWPNGHPTFIAVPEDRSYGHKEAQRDGQIVADFTLAGDKWAALFALIIKRMPAILAALSTDRAPAVSEEAGWQPIETAPRDGSAILLGYFRQNLDGSIYQQGGEPVVARWLEPGGGMLKRKDGVEANWVARRERLLSGDGPFAPTRWRYPPAPPTTPTEEPQS